MWVFDAQSQMINSSAAIMRAFTVAVASSVSASACQGMKVWSGLMQAEPVMLVPWRQSALNSWSPLSSWQAWTSAYAAQWAQSVTGVQATVIAAEPEEAKPVVPSNGSSYRSAGGHAVAQVVIG